jgi:hypothetical protein
MAVWTDPTWLQDAHAWIGEELARLGVEPTGEITQPHVRPWSTVLRVQASEDDLWFKANLPSLAYEAAVLSIFDQGRLGPIPPLLAVDLERGWILMGDAGVRLRELVAEERSLDRWLALLPLYARLQIESMREVDRFVAAGVPHRRLDDLPDEYASLLDEVRGLDPEELARLRGLEPRVQEMCDELAELAIPDAIQHDDLHDGQVFFRNGDYVFADWGDSCVSHPFFSMSVTLEGQLAWGLDDIENSTDLRPFAAAYLEPFSSYGRTPELGSALATALRLGWVCRAINVQRWALALGPQDGAEHLDGGVALRLRAFLAGLP